MHRSLGDGLQIESYEETKVPFYKCDECAKKREHRDNKVIKYSIVAAPFLTIGLNIFLRMKFEEFIFGSFFHWAFILTNLLVTFAFFGCIYFILSTIYDTNNLIAIKTNPDVIKLQKKGWFIGKAPGVLAT